MTAQHPPSGRRLDPALFVGRSAATPQESADWSPQRILMTDLRAVRGRAYPRVSGLLREKSWLFFEILLPFLTTSAFVFVYRALQAPPEYIGFVLGGRCRRSGSTSCG
jgi:hypothetical protein